nr:hypothetical protein [uncultured Niameybacter sp.]
MKQYSKIVKIKISLLVLGILVCTLGLSYASWTDTLVIQQQVTTGNMDFDLEIEKINHEAVSQEKIDFSYVSDQVQVEITNEINWEAFQTGSPIEITYRLEPKSTTSVLKVAPKKDEVTNGILIIEWINVNELEKTLVNTPQLDKIKNYVKDNFVIEQEIPVEVSCTTDEEDVNKGILTIKAKANKSAQSQSNLTYTVNTYMEGKAPEIQVPIQLKYTLSFELGFDQFNMVKGDKDEKDF